MSRAYVLHSGGIDSTTCLYYAIQEFQTVTAVSVFYGQRHSREINASQDICEELNKLTGTHVVKHETHHMRMIDGSVLTDPDSEVPDVMYENIEGVSPMYVPFRNGQLLSLITALAVLDNEAEAIYFGAHAEDAERWAYPDCTPEFIGAMANAIYIGTYHKLRLHTPLQWLTKHQVIGIGMELGVPFGLTWSCYKGERLHCGSCATCYARHQAFKDAGVADSTKYLSTPEPEKEAP